MELGVAMNMYDTYNFILAGIILYGAGMLVGFFLGAAIFRDMSRGGTRR